jgi:hypothetical protein
MPVMVRRDGTSPRQSQSRIATQTGLLVAIVVLAAIDVKANEGIQAAKWIARKRPAPWA